jgi:hypothetical protein
MPVASTTAHFIEKAKFLQDDFYDYSKSKYVNQYTKVIITCRYHGDFLQTPHDHYKGRGCMKCSLNKRRPKLQLEEIIRKANLLYNNKYSYEKSVYTGIDKLFTVTCPYHGDFNLNVQNHLRGQECKHCRIHKNSLSPEEFVNKANAFHNSKFDYSKTNYRNMRLPVIIICPVHGEFSIAPKDHLYGLGCKQCNIDKKNNKNVN